MIDRLPGGTSRVRRNLNQEKGIIEAGTVTTEEEMKKNWGERKSPRETRPGAWVTEE